MKLGLILAAMFVLTVVSNSNSQTPSANSLRKVQPDPSLEQLENGLTFDDFNALFSAAYLVASQPSFS